jgi:hypothetical protein
MASVLTSMNTRFALLLSVLFLLIGCRREQNGQAQLVAMINPSTPIHIVVPLGFRGKIEIKEDKVNGVIPTVRKDFIEINIPADGHIDLKDWSSFFQDHSEQAFYSDGTAVPDPIHTPVGQEFPRSEVGYYMLGTEISTAHPQEILTDFVGTKDELDQLK